MANGGDTATDDVLAGQTIGDIFRQPGIPPLPELLAALISSVKRIIAGSDGLNILYQQKSLSIWQPTIMPLELMLEGLRRGIITDNQADNLLVRSGYRDSARTVIKQLGVTLLGAAEMIEAYRRGAIDSPTLFQRLDELGYDAKDQGVIRDISSTLLTVGDNVELWRRELITDDQFRIGVKALGYSDQDTSLIKQLALNVPPAQDVIRFLVRDVYSPDIRGALELDADFPESSLPAFKAAGLSERYARDTWAAHWVLPSLTSTYTLFHRGLIDRNDVEFILRANDVLPKYRDALVEAAYRVPTRVDARRYHALGIVDYDELVAIYQSQGFSPTDAKRQADFTVEYNRQPPQQDTEEIRQLTRSQIERLYRRSLISRQVAVSALESIQYDPDDADVILDLIDIQQSEEQRDIGVDIVRRRYDTGLIDYNEAVGELNALDLPAAELTRLLLILEAERQTKIHLPNRGELDKMFQADLLGRDEYVKQLNRLGWPTYWAEKWAALAGKEEAPDTPSQGAEYALYG